MPRTTVPCNDARTYITTGNQQKTKRPPFARHRTWFWGAVILSCGVPLATTLRRLPPVAPALDGPPDPPDRGGDGTDRTARYWKYYRTYRYAPPASRRDVMMPPPAEACGAAPHYARWFKQKSDARSRLQEDKIVYEALFKNHRNISGTYLELGAFDGKMESNSRFFDECLGWKGLLIEGNPHNFMKTVAHRPFAHKMSLAPSCSVEYEAVNKTIPFYQHPFLNTGLTGHAKTYAGKVTVLVPCGPLAPVLADVFAANAHAGGLPTLDFFSLDVEGAEALVLATVNFQAVRINVLMIETQNKHCGEVCEVRRQVRARMSEEGYRRYEGLVKRSDVYVHPKSMFQIPEYIAKPQPNENTT